MMERYEGTYPHARAPLKREKIALRILILSGVACMAVFLTWFFSTVTPGVWWLYYPFTIGLLFKLLKMIHEWYHYFDISVPVRPKSEKIWTVDILTTACPGEPYEMFDRTLRAMVAVKYPHTNYLCDEGNDPKLKALCDELGVIHVTRTEKINAKAGNINNALKQATGELAVVLDPDHIPHPDFLHRVVDHFEDPKVGYVQMVQGYYNQDESFVAKGAAEQTYHFYGPMMMCMNSYGTVQAIGANCTFRRKALDDIGGHAPGLAEDMHTAMQIHAKGYKSLYVPEMLTKGLVPSTMAAFYKQQLKWARGTFELLFVTYPKLCRNFTWRQNIHYFTLPLYYLFGVFNLIDILIPSISLLIADVAWNVEVDKFFLIFSLLLSLSLLTRMYAQRWLMSDSERGLHLMGGILRFGCWWVFIMGFVYTIFRVNVPYIPTPKEGVPENNIKLSLPNLIIAIVIIASVWYGLSIDYTPYSLAMAGFALINAFILLFVVLLAQEKFLLSVKSFISRNATGKVAFKIRDLTHQAIHGGCTLARNGALMFAFIILLFFTTALINQNKSFSLASLAPPDMKETGGFYTGIYLPELQYDRSTTYVDQEEKQINTSFDIISIYEAWGPKSLDSFPMGLLNDIHRRGAVPMITWEPWTCLFPEFAKDPKLSKNKRICLGIYDGKLDFYIKAYARKIREYKHPVFLRYAHEPDNPVYPWSQSGENTPGEYISAWRHVVEVFEHEGVHNVTWVWNPWSHSSIDEYFPGGRYIDWIGLTALNYGTASTDKKWLTFDDIYLPFRKKALALKRPIMLAEFGSTSYGGNRAAWMQDALGRIEKHYKEINSVVFFDSDHDKTWPTEWRPDDTTQFVNWSVQKDPSSLAIINNHITREPFNDRPFMLPSDLAVKETKVKEYNSPFIFASNRGYNLAINSQPFYVKGVAYNTEHDWRDGHLPLTRKQLEKDFRAIREMGANTIRRYNPGPYDENILNIAHEQGLKVMYGFWFDPKKDYYKDTAEVRRQMEQVLYYVQKYKDHPAVLAWNVGNETWGLLKHTFSKPYLSEVRNQYLNMVQTLAEQIHRIDPSRPVLSSMEHEEFQIRGEFAAFQDLAPSLDIIGVNSYYKQQISKLDKIAADMSPDRPYMITEFGPRGYWERKFSRYMQGRVWEDEDDNKAIYYKDQWTKIIYPNRGRNLGGIAYCWKERMEGSSTWFGITDHNGNKKPAYYALQSCFRNTNDNMPDLQKVLLTCDSRDKDGKYIFSAKVFGGKERKLRYKWTFNREEYLDEVNNIERTDEPQIVKLTLPETPSYYRLYLHVTDDAGHVVTASYPVTVEK
jgi:cellulose synthase (UDP-forming)